MTAQPLIPEPDRQAIDGGHMLAGVEADILGDDPFVREQLAELHRLLHCWQTAGAQAVCVHLRLADPEDTCGYVPADLTNALGDYRFSCGLVRTKLRTISTYLFRED